MWEKLALSQNSYGESEENHKNIQKYSRFPRW